MSVWPISCSPSRRGDLLHLSWPKGLTDGFWYLPCGAGYYPCMHRHTDIPNYSSLCLTHQLKGCPQVIAHSDCAIYSNKLHYLLFFKIFVELQSFECHMTCMCAIYLLKSLPCAIYSRKIAISFKISGHPCQSCYFPPHPLLCGVIICKL